MPLISPFAGLRPLPEKANEVVAPPYDVLNTEEARERAKGKPWSFLHISKPEIDLPKGTDPYDASVYQTGSDNLQKMIKEGILKRDEQPCYYFYQLQMGDHVQTGLVAAASVEAYDHDRIKKHEFTRPVKEDDRVRQIDALNAQTGPVFLAYRGCEQVNAIVNEVTASEPDMNVTADDGVRHTLWVVSDHDKITTLTTAFSNIGTVDTLYVADGHHRSAAGSRVGAMRKKANPHHKGNESYNYFLSVMFPAEQLEILDYNRVVKDLNGHSADELLQLIAKDFTVKESASQYKPTQPGEFGMYLDGKWYQLNINPGLIPTDPVKRLDVSLLADNLIEPFLGISDPRTDDRIDFVGGIRGLGELEKRVNSGEMAIAFSMYATRMEDLMAVADAGEVMPPKSTWFEPKLADGVVSHVLD